MRGSYSIWSNPLTNVKWHSDPRPTVTSQTIRLSTNFMTFIPSLTFTELWVVSMEHLQRVWLASRERLPFRTPGSVPLFGICLSSNCWDQIPRTCHVFTRLFTLNTPWYFLDFASCAVTTKLSSEGFHTFIVVLWVYFTIPFGFGLFLAFCGHYFSIFWTTRLVEDHWLGFVTRNARMVHIVNLIRLKFCIHLSEVRWIGCLTSQSTIFQPYMWRHIDVQADWRRSSWTYGRAPNAIDIS